MDFPTSTVKNVIDAETGETWDCTLVGKAGELGCLQIRPELHPEVDPLDFDASVRYFISEYQADRGWQWTSCSCVTTARAIGLRIPPHTNAEDLQPNTPMAVGTGILLHFSTGYHVGVVTKLTETSIIYRDGNAEPCSIGTHSIPYNHKAIRGFYLPPDTT